MKILLISNLFPTKEYPYYGTFVKNIVDGLTERNVEFQKVVLNKDGKSKLKEYIVFYTKILINLFKNSSDITYVHYISHCSIPIFFSKTPRNLVVNVHGSDIQTKGMKGFLLEPFIRNVLHKSTKIIVPSLFYKDLVLKKYMVEEDKIFVSPSGGIDRSVFYNRNERNTGKINIGFASRLVKSKGADVFLKSINHLSDNDRNNINFYLVGDGNEKNSIKKYIEQYKIRINCDFTLLNQEDLSTYLNKLDCFVFPSKVESLGLIGLEALACGCFLIGSDNFGITTYLEDGKNGFVFTNGDHVSLARRIEDYINLNEIEKNILLKNGLKTAEKYSKEYVINNLYSKFESILKGSSK